MVKKGVFAGLGFATILILLYQFGNAVCDALTSLFNYNIPQEVYGVLALLFIFGMTLILLKQRG